MKLVLALVLYTNLILSQVWVKLPDFPSSKRDDGVAVVVNEKAYFGTGLQEWNATIDFYALDLKSNTWSAIPAMPHTTERQYACVFADKTCFYVFGGDGGNGALNNLYKYDITASSWNAMSSKPGNGLIGAMCMPFGDKIIISGGKFTSGKVSNEVWEYTLSSDSWIQKNNYPFSGRWRSGATVLNGIGYLLFGRDTAGVFRKELYTYNPFNDMWTKLSDFPLSKGRAYASLGHTNSKLCVFGGQDSLNTFYKDIWYFDITSNTWIQGPDLPGIGRRGGMACNYEDLFIYSCGLGEGSLRLNETWVTQIPLRVKESHKAEIFSVFPIPTKENINLRLHSELEYNSKLYIELTDIFGNKVVCLNELNPERKITTSFLPSGIYLLKLYSENGLIEVKKIIKE